MPISAVVTNQCSSPDEEYTECGSSCPDTCRNYRDVTRVCTLQCVPGCFCKAGLVRDESSGQCIAPENCTIEPECSGQNEVFNSCGTACPDTCENYKTPNRPCTRQCVIGCFCKQGYVRNADKVCVLPDECPAPEPECSGQNEVFNSCGTACPDTCENYKTPNRPCTRQCVIGCFCKQGYVRNADKVCVLPEECPAPEPECSGQNEVFNSCGTACPDTCENYKTPNRPCTRQCVIGCFCKQGYVRNADKVCVLPEECPPPEPECSGQNEEFNFCGTACPVTCENYKTPNRRCTRQCVIGCFCKQGYVRNAESICVLPEDCPTPEPTCPNPNEKYTTCGTMCPLTCRNYNNVGMCPLMCVPGCFCETGYVRNDDNLCVPKDSCPHVEFCIIRTKFEQKPKPGDACEKACDGSFKCGPPPPGRCPCKGNYYRDSQRQCVPFEKCPRGCSGRNEIYDLRRHKDLQCKSLYDENKSLKAPVAGCFCKRGYARDNGTCKPFWKCF